MISYDNSLKEIISILLKIGKWMQQGSDLLSPLFISNFHWRREQNRARYNKAPRIAAFIETMFRTLFCRDTRVQIPSPAYLPRVEFYGSLIAVFKKS